MPGVLFAPEANSYRSPGDKDNPLWSADYIDYMIENEGGSNKVAAVIVEPVVGSNGIIPPPPGYMQRLRQICDNWDVLLIADETMSGMGRTGKMFAIEHYNVVPDIIVMGKALGMYCPLSAMILTEKVARVFDENLFGHGQSFSCHALGCAAALAGIEVIEEEDILQRTTELGHYLGERLKALANKYPQVGDVRGLGLFWTLELVKDRETQEPLRKTTEKYVKTVVSDVADYLMREKSIYVPADKFGVWVVPPLVVTREELDFVVDAIDEALTSVLPNVPKP